MSTKQPKYARVWKRIKGTKHWRRTWKRNPAWRDEIKTAMDWALAHEPQIHYLQQRPFDVDAIKDRKLPLSADCSATTTQLYRAAGRPDPNGCDYSGLGWTGTIRAMGALIALASAKTGDTIVYGRNGGVHVVVVYKPGPDPLVFSHGQEKGPFLIHHSQEVAAHGSYFTVHNGDSL